MSGLANASVEHTAIGRIVIPRNVPPAFRLFYTTIDFDGRIDDRIHDFVRPAELFSCHQVHGIAVRGPRSAARKEECDALWSDAKQTALAIKVADCLPVSIIDPKHAVIANIHSGWRGTVQRITTVTLDAAPLDPRESFAFLGPSIRACCFEVGEEVAAQFDVGPAPSPASAAEGGGATFVDRTRGPKPHIDIAALTIALLRQRGFAREKIVDTELCTKCPESIFHSYRRDKKSGRNLAIVAQ